MNDNVVKFRKPVPPKKPREPLGPKARKALTIAVVIAFSWRCGGISRLWGRGRHIAAYKGARINYSPAALFFEQGT